MDDTSGFRARTYSDPDLPQLLPIPVRPHSSYESRPVDKEYMQFDPDVIEAMALLLGVSVEAQSQFQWIIRDCLLKLKEEGWICQLREGSRDIVFVHMASEEIRSSHEIVDVHRKFAERLIQEWKDINRKRRDRLYLVKEIVHRAVLSERDIRRVPSPKNIEALMDLLGVDPANEPYLIRIVKLCLEDAFFKVKSSGGAHAVTVDNVTDVVGLLVKLALERISFMKKISPSGLLYCTECETALADGICASCHDALCNSCHVALHSTGHRLDHLFVFTEQCVCSECETHASVVRCVDCSDLFCAECFKAQHRTGKRKRHCVRLPTTTFCFECDEAEGAHLCMECEDILCSNCASTIHRRGARQNHTMYGLRKAVYSKKLFADNMDSVLSILTRNIAAQQPVSAWLLFYDEALNPYWYNFHSKETIRTTLQDLLHAPPEPAPVEGEEAADARYARLATEGAVFHVPPPMHVKFASPATAMDVASGGILRSTRSTFEVTSDLKGLSTTGMSGGGMRASHPLQFDAMPPTPEQTR